MHADFDAEASTEEPNYSITVETLGMDFILICQYDGKIIEGNIIRGVAWLYGDLKERVKQSITDLPIHL